ncbi:1254_t:CDS:2 [Rhizophagus irregularis]|nr:1254_t:CDS:2 [Rhizophagus irregularis]
MSLSSIRDDNVKDAEFTELEKCPQCDKDILTPSFEAFIVLACGHETRPLATYYIIRGIVYQENYMGIHGEVILSIVLKKCSIKQYLVKNNVNIKTTFAKNGIPGWQVAAGETATGNLRRARLNLNAELEISDDDNGNNVDDNDEGSDDASDNGSDDNTHNSIHDSDDSEDVSDRMRQLTV